ncbi:zinc finger HIT domain-containing protein 2 [Melopsittacus undulatus]|uniref:Uncharacterized protein n=1 Tax=Melopsittacus undulatus TaxID=13146 RepID=A0A8V5GUI8_MELUD|nr:zinc finger HIT domain-containing protein 2 [Melopsittacus undulatus]
MAAPMSDPRCSVCAAAAPYTCPRCGLRVCSVRCYRSHGACAEAFYRDQVLQTLRSERGPPPGRARVASAVTRLQELREPEDPPGPGPAELWSSLTAAEREGFLRLLHSAEASAVLPPWRPWWRRPEPCDDPEPAPSAPVPAPPPPPLASLRSQPPSPLLRFQVPNVLLGYVLALSAHRGLEELLPELPAAAVAASAALRSRCALPSTAAAIEAALGDAQAAGLPPGPLGRAGAVRAVAELLEGGGGADAEAALAHLERLLRAGEGRAESDFRSRFARARRKCRFLRAWSRESAGTVGGMGAEVREVLRGMGEGIGNEGS